MTPSDATNEKPTDDGKGEGKVRGYDRIRLTPYPATLYVAPTPKIFERLVREKLKNDPPLELHGGLCMVVRHKEEGVLAVVWGASMPNLVHEVSHCILALFDVIGIDPREASGEPFCYMISYILNSINWDRISGVEALGVKGE